MYNKVRVCGNILEVKATVCKNGNVRRGGGGEQGKGEAGGDDKKFGRIKKRMINTVPCD